MLGRGGGGGLCFYFCVVDFSFFRSGNSDRVSVSSLPTKKESTGMNIANMIDQYLPLPMVLVGDGNSKHVEYM